MRGGSVRSGLHFRVALAFVLQVVTVFPFATGRRRTRSSGCHRFRQLRPAGAGLGAADKEWNGSAYRNTINAAGVGCVRHSNYNKQRARAEGAQGELFNERVSLHQSVCFPFLCYLILLTNLIERRAG